MLAIIASSRGSHAVAPLGREIGKPADCPGQCFGVTRRDHERRAGLGKQLRRFAADAGNDRPAER